MNSTALVLLDNLGLSNVIGGKNEMFPVFLKSKKVEIRGYTFPFTMYADPIVQQFVFECGMGAFTNRGFGMLDRVRKGFARDTVDFPCCRRSDRHRRSYYLQ